MDRKKIAKKITFNKGRGTTLVELMVSITVLLLLISSVGALMTSGRRLWMTSATQMDITSSGRAAMDKMYQELSQASMDSVSISSGKDSITFQIPSSFLLSVTAWGNPIQYSLGGLNGEQLLRTDLVTSDVEVLGNNITFLQFDNTTLDDVIDIELILRKQTIKGDLLTVELGSQIQLRNE